MLWKPNWIGTALWINVLRNHALMYLAGNYCYRIKAMAPPGVADTPLTQITRDNTSKPN